MAINHADFGIAATSIKSRTYNNLCSKLLVYECPGVEECVPQTCSNSTEGKKICYAIILFALLFELNITKREMGQLSVVSCCLQTAMIRLELTS